MIAFEVSLNGKKACVAGVGEQGVLSANICWVRRGADQPGPVEEMFLEVGGLKTPEQESLRWRDQQLIKVGDEVHVKVVRAKRVSKPTSRHSNNPAETLLAQKRYVRQMAKKFGWKVVTR